MGVNVCVLGEIRKCVVFRTKDSSFLEIYISAEWLILVISKVQQRVILVSKLLMVSDIKNEVFAKNNLYSLVNTQRARVSFM